MWYFAWILGVTLACCFGILNAIWYEVNSDRVHERDQQLKQPGNL